MASNVPATSRSAPNPTGWSRWVPGLATIRTYQSSWLRHDIFAGLVLTAMLVPVGIAYASASGLPGICGLYATIVPLLVSPLFGAEPYPGAGAGFLTRGAHPRGRIAALRRQPHPRGGTCRGNGNCLRSGVHSGRAGAAPGFE